VIPVARARRAIFARHCNPWSAWTRWASTPLTLVPIWTRGPGHAVLLGVWLVLNPVVFGKPAHHRSWAARAMLGEELWVAHRPRDYAMLLSVVTSAVAAFAAVAARRRQLKPALIAVAAQMALTMLYWQLMVRYFDRQTPSQ
jgi:hypothetical protein